MGESKCFCTNLQVEINHSKLVMNVKFMQLGRYVHIVYLATCVYISMEYLERCLSYDSRFKFLHDDAYDIAMFNVKISDSYHFNKF